MFVGRCRLRNLYNIKETDLKKESAPIVANSREASTVAFVAPGPNDQHVLYIASSYVEGGGHFRDDVSFGFSQFFVL